jgi:IS605 OrfB family transposase
LAKTKPASVIENLHVAGLLKHHHLAQAIGDVGLSRFRRQLPYKADWYGSRVILADRWKPSSKTCSGCGWVDEQVTLADRTFHCQNPWVACGLVLDRDGNAAINLSKLAGSSSDRQNACGEGSAGLDGSIQVQLPSRKQQPDTKHGLSTFGHVLEDGVIPYLATPFGCDMQRSC